MEVGDSISGALFGGRPDRRHRYALWRVWDKALPKLLFIGLNPSTAAEYKDDPTIRRLIGFAKAWGYGSLFAGNLFSLVTPYPWQLWHWCRVENVNDYRETTRENDNVLKEMFLMTDRSLVAWGNDGAKAGNRPTDVLALFGKPVYCLGMTKSGEPKHPLYMPLTSKMVVYRQESIKGPLFLPEAP